MLSRILKKPDKDFLNLEFSGFYMLFSCLFLYYACFLSYSFNDNFPVMSKIFSCLVYISPVRPSKDRKQQQLSTSDQSPVTLGEIQTQGPAF